MLNVYRPGKDAAFSDYEASVIEHFGIIVALALDSARQRELLRSQAERDDLTGLLNRRAFHQQLDALVQTYAAHRTTLGRSHLPLMIMLAFCGRVDAVAALLPTLGILPPVVEGGNNGGVGTHASVGSVAGGTSSARTRLANAALVWRWGL